jgi:nucleoside-diphosphate-sugar epimerase
VFLAAAKVGGILANSRYPADFIGDNLAIQLNVIQASWKYGVKKLEFLGSSCIYPKFAPQPITEDNHLFLAAGADQRMVCNRQNCRAQAVSGLPAAV